MSSEDNWTIVLRFIDEVLNANSSDALDHLYAAEAVDHALPAVMPGGRAGTRLVLDSIRTVFPDIRYTVEDVIAEGDRVVVRFTRTGTHQGEIFGAPPSGKELTWTGIDIFRVAEGKIVEHWTSFDQLGMYQQLGIIPST